MVICTLSAMEISERLSANIYVCTSSTFGGSENGIAKRIGDKIAPWGTPESTP